MTHAENPDGSGSGWRSSTPAWTSPAFGPDHLFNFRIGKLAPNLYDGFQEMWLLTDNGIDSLFTYNPIGLHGGTGSRRRRRRRLPARVRGIEVYGVAAHRFFYTVGVSHPSGRRAQRQLQQSSPQGHLWRFDYKFGGMGLDGDTRASTCRPRTGGRSRSGWAFGSGEMEGTSRSP